MKKGLTVKSLVMNSKLQHDRGLDSVYREISELIKGLHEKISQ